MVGLFSLSQVGLFFCRAGFPARQKSKHAKRILYLTILIWNTAFGFTLIYNTASGFNRIHCHKKNRILSENAGHARNFNSNMQDLPPQTKAKNCKNFISGLQCCGFHNIIKFSFKWVKLLYWRWSYQDLMIKILMMTDTKRLSKKVPEGTPLHLAITATLQKAEESTKAQMKITT